MVVEEQVLDEREADLLIQAQRKRYNEAPSRVSLQRSTSSRKSPTKSRSPIPEELSEDLSPRKGIMRFFGVSQTYRALQDVSAWKHVTHTFLCLYL